MRLRSATVLICLALSLIATFYGAYSRFNVAQDILIEETYENFEKIAELKKIEVERFIESEKEKIEILKTCPAILDILSSDKGGNFDSDLYLSAKNRIDDLERGVGIFDLDGIILVSENNPPGTNYSEIILGDYDFKIIYYYDLSRKMNYLGIISPIFDSDTNEKLGYIGLDVELEDLNEIIKGGIVLGKTGEMYLIDEDRVLMTPSRFFENGQFVQKVETENSKKCFNDENGAVEKFLNYRGEVSIGTHRHLSFIDWCLIVEIEENELLQEINDRLIISSILVSLVIIVSLVMLGFFLGDYLERIYLKKKRKIKKDKYFLKKLSKISFLSYFIFSLTISVIYFIIAFYFFNNFFGDYFFKVITNLIVFIVSFMILSFALKMKNGYKRNLILSGSILICFKRLINFPFLEEQIILNSSMGFLWYPIFLLEYLGFLLLLVGYRRFKDA